MSEAVPQAQAAPAGAAAVTRPRPTFVRDSWVIARRGLVHMRRQPEALADATFQPIMFVLLFAYVFGGAIGVPGGGSYKEFLMGGIFAQTLVFGTFGVAMGLATDRQSGAIDRFHSLPIHPACVLAGHALTSLLRALLPIVLMSATGLAIGWRSHAGPGDVAVGYGLMIAFSFAMIWIGVLLGSVMSSPEGVQGVAFVVIFPITFISSTFVPTSTLPGVLRVFAEWNPTTSLANALRDHFGNPGGAVADGAPWSLAHPTAYTLGWTVGIVGLCAPVAVRAYQRAVRH